jgi:ribosomal protein S18 acetylase RimI-like enzyme
MLQDIIDEARRRSMPVALRTQTSNRAVNLYRRIGFQEIGQTDSHIVMEWRPF